jgi:hypothetical protein
MATIEQWVESKETLEEGKAKLKELKNSLHRASSLLRNLDGQYVRLLKAFYDDSEESEGLISEATPHLKSLDLVLAQVLALGGDLTTLRARLAPLIESPEEVEE